MSSSNAKDHAEYFRRRGYSLREIASLTNVSKSALSQWLKNVSVDSEGKIRMEKRLNLLQRRSGENNYKRRKNREYAIKNSAKKAIDSLKTASPDQTKLLCALLYYCEGSRSPKEGVTFTNSDPALLRAFIKLLKKGFRVNESRFKLRMHLHKYHNEEKQKRFWSKITGLPPEQFSKSFFKKEATVYKRTNYQGCLRVRYGNADIARELLEIARFYFQKIK